MVERRQRHSAGRRHRPDRRDAKAAAPDSTFAGLQCLRALWTGAGRRRPNACVAASPRSAPACRARGCPSSSIHGVDDGLVPAAFTSAPYVAKAQAAGRDVRYWQVRNAQHFDAFLALPDYRARYVPLLPYVYAALDRVAAHLDDPSQPLPADAVIETAPAAAPLTAAPAGDPA